WRRRGRRDRGAARHHGILNFARPDNMLKKTIVGSALATALMLPALADKRDDKEAGSQASAKAALRQALFFDPSLASPAGQSCATCHATNAAFADPDRSLPVSKGVLHGRVGNRNTPTAMYAAFSPDFHFDNEEGLYVGGQFLDGRA